MGTGSDHDQGLCILDMPADPPAPKTGLGHRLATKSSRAPFFLVLTTRQGLTENVRSNG